MKKTLWLLNLLGVCLHSILSLAYPIPPTQGICDPVLERAHKEEFIPLPYIGIAFHKPNYILPFYYTGSPDNRVYKYHMPFNERIKNTEVKYQVSLKVPIWKNMYDCPVSLYFAFTLRTYWQVYNKSPFIRATDYEPEFFLRHAFQFPLYRCWTLDFFNVGFVHQSNGCGNRLQRSWDRIYVEATTSVDDWMISLKPWVIVMTYGNSNIADFLGYATLLIAYKFHQQVFSLQWTNIGTAPKRATANFTWSFPINCYLKGYAEIFSGYGQSLVEYNHRTNSIGIGLALSDWI